MQNHLLHKFRQHINVDIGLNAGTGVGHNQPVGGINQYAFEKGPLAAHKRFNRMNCTEPFPENAITIFTLCQHRSLTGKAAISIDKLFGIRVDKTGNVIDIAAGKIGTAIPFTALTTFSAFKQRVGTKSIRRHDESPKLFSK